MKATIKRTMDDDSDFILRRDPARGTSIREWRLTRLEQIARRARWQVTPEICHNMVEHATKNYANVMKMGNV